MAEQAERVCPEHGTPIRVEPLTRPDGKQIGNITSDVCDRCVEQADDDLDAFLSRIADGDFGGSR